MVGGNMAAVPAFPILCRRFPPHGITHAGGRKQIPFVAGIYKHLCPNLRPPSKHPAFLVEQDCMHALDVRSVFAKPVQAGMAQNADAGMRYIRIHHLLRHMGLEHPALQLAVMLPEFPVELPGKPLDHLFIANIGKAEPAGGEPANMSGRLHYNHAVSLQGCASCSHHTRRCTAVYAHVILFGA